MARITDAETVEHIKRVAAAYPELTDFGFGIYNDYSKKTHEQLRIEFAQNREQLYESRACEGFNIACRFLSHIDRTKHINHSAGTSYGLKHTASGWARDVIGKAIVGDGYMTNGVFIAAAAHMGFKVERCGDGPNACFNISRRSLRELAEQRRAVLRIGRSVELDDF